MRLTCRAAGSWSWPGTAWRRRAQALRRHGNERRLATLVATVAYLEARSVDDCLELLDLLMMTELLGKAEAAADRERARRHPVLARHSARLAAAVEVLLEVTDAGCELTLEQVWESIEAVVPRRQLRESVDAVSDMVLSSGSDADAEARARLTERIATVVPFPEDPDRGHQIRQHSGG